MLMFCALVYVNIGLLWSCFHLPFVADVSPELFEKHGTPRLIAACVLAWPVFVFDILRGKGVSGK